MKESKLYGVELDSITGRIAKKLYPNAEIQVKGFEETNYPNNFFDVAIEYTIRFFFADKFQGAIRHDLFGELTPHDLRQQRFFCIVLDICNGDRLDLRVHHGTHVITAARGDQSKQNECRQCKKSLKCLHR